MTITHGCSYPFFTYHFFWRVTVATHGLEVLNLGCFDLVLSVQRCRGSRDPRKISFWNAPSPTPTPVDDARAYLEIRMDNKIEKGRTSTMGSEPNNHILELAAPDNTRYRILNTVENNHKPHVI